MIQKWLKCKKKKHLKIQDKYIENIINTQWKKNIFKYTSLLIEKNCILNI